MIYKNSLLGAIYGSVNLPP